MLVCLFCMFLTENVGSRKRPLEKVQRVNGHIQGAADGSDALLERGGVCTGYVSVHKSLHEPRDLAQLNC